MKRFIRTAAVIVSLLTSIMVQPFAMLSANAEGTALWPVDNCYQEITTYFNPDRNNGDTSGLHNGIDIPAPRGANIYAVNDGVCVCAGWMDAYGYMVILYHEQQGLYTFYAHCSSMAVAVGESVEAGKVIAYVGNTGMSFGDHLHFGICTNIRGGFPTTYYYDPLTYFAYGEAQTPVDCGCVEDYAGTYVTKGVDTYLNIRSGHSTTSTILGKIMPGEEFNVVKADGTWAHIEHDGVIGCCYMEFIQKTGDIVSNITASDTTCPEGTLKHGEAFSVRGKLTSNLTIRRVWGGVYAEDGKTDVTTAEASPNALTYDLSGIDSRILFDRLNNGNYVYRIEAEDSSGQVYTIVSSVFSVGEAAVTTSPAESTTTTSTTTTTTTAATTKATTTSSKPAETTTTTAATTKATSTASATTTATKPAETTTTAATTVTAVCGDANCDGEVTIADAAAILQHLGNRDRFPLSAKGKRNSDVNGKDGMTTADAFIIQQYIAGEVKSLPVKTSHIVIENA